MEWGVLVLLSLCVCLALPCFNSEVVIKMSLAYGFRVRKECKLCQLTMNH